MPKHTREEQIEKIEFQLSDPLFLKKAPPDAIERLRSKLNHLHKVEIQTLSCPGCGTTMKEYLGYYWCESGSIRKPWESGPAECLQIFTKIQGV